MRTCLLLSRPNSGGPRQARITLAVALTLQLGLTGCAMAPPTLVEGPLAVFERGAPAGPTDAVWWKTASDPQLDQLVDAALDGSITVQAAAKRLELARVGDEATFWSLMPKGELVTRSSYAKTTSYKQDGQSFATPPAQASHNTAFSVSWEVPLFGKAQASLGLQKAQRDQAQWQLDAARVAVAAEVVRTYAELQGTLAALEALQAQDAQLELLAKGERALAEAGNSTQAEVDRWTGEQLQTSQQVRSLQAQVTKLQARLATVVGRPSLDSNALKASSLLQQPVPHVTEVRAANLRARPDVRAAEAAVMAAAAQVGIARASLWPQFTLGGDLNLLQGRLDSLGMTSGSTSSVSMTAGLSIPLLNWFTLHTQAKAKSKELEVAVLEYRQTVLTAWEEAQTAYADYAEALDKQTLAQKAVALAQTDAARQERLRDAGAATKLDVARARIVIAQRSSAAQSNHAAALQAWARLTKATFVAVPH